MSTKQDDIERQFAALEGSDASAEILLEDLRWLSRQGNHPRAAFTLARLFVEQGSFLAARKEVEFLDRFAKAAAAGFAAVEFLSPYEVGVDEVKARVDDHVKGPKLIVMHFRRRKNSKTRYGHRQRYTKVQIETIEV